MNSTLYFIMDVDWAHDDVVRYALDVFEGLGVPVTVFVTHASPVIDDMRERRNVEIGLHPNFNDLLNGRAPAGDNAEKRIEDLHAVAPEAQCIRSHSMCQNSYLLNLFDDLGFTHEVNTLVMAHAGIELKPWRHWKGSMVRVPTVFEDSLAGHLPNGWDPVRLAGHPGLRVLNFHPVRVFLNAGSPALAGPRDAATWAPADLAEHVCRPEQPGSRWFIEALVAAHRAGAGDFGLIGDIRP